MTDEVYDDETSAPPEETQPDVEPAEPAESNRFGGVGDVEENDGIIVAGTGPTNIGPGMQHVGDVTLSASGTVVYQVGPQSMLSINHGLEAARHRVRHRDISEETVRRLRDCFRRPTGFTEALDVLLRNRVVLLDGEVDGGRRYTALALLDGVPPSSAPGRFRDLDPDADDDRSVLDNFKPHVGDRLRLDLVDVDGPRLNRHMAAIDDFRTVLQRHDAHLVVVLGPEGAFAVPGGLHSLRATVGRPDAREVLVAHLKADGLPVGPAAVPADEELAGEVAGASLGRVARYADEVRRIVGSNSSVSVEEALARSRWVLLRDYELDVRKIFEGKDPRQKALMLSVAMLEGATADAICGAEEKLLEIIEYPRGEDHWIARVGLGSRLTDLNAQWDTRRLVHFRRPGYALAVRTVFWDDFPEKRDVLCRWVAGIPGRPGARGVRLAPPDCVQLAHRFTDQALRTHRPDHVTSLVENWTARSAATNTSVAAASTALALGVSDPVHGWRVRETTYRWSRQHDLAEPLAQILLHLCLNILKTDRPLVAMRRLHNLTRHTSPDIAEPAMDELVGWASRDAYVRRHLVLRSAQPPGWWRPSPRDASLFLRLAHLVLADARAGDTELEAVLDDRYRAALDIADRGESAAWVEGWLAVAADEARGANAANDGHDDRVRAVDLLDRVVDSCRGRLDLLSRLHRHLAVGTGDSDGREGRRHVQSRIEQHLRIGGAPGSHPISAQPDIDESGVLP